MKALLPITLLLLSAIPVSVEVRASPSWKPIPNPVCDKLRATALDEAFKYLQKIDDVVPQVPPEEAAYFEKEYRPALNQVSPEGAHRFGVMASRPYFSAWELHNAVARAKDRLEDVKKLPQTASPKEYIQASSRTDFSRAEVLSSWTEYTHSQLANNLSGTEISNTSYYAARLSGLMGEYEWCWAYLVPD